MLDKSRNSNRAKVIISANNLYGDTFTQFNDILPQFGITTKLVDPNKSENYIPAINDNTRMLYCEIVGNPALDVADIEAIAKIAHDHGLLLVVDSTFSTPFLQRLIESAADMGPVSAAL